jgi:hypothetical protein
MSYETRGLNGEAALHVDNASDEASIELLGDAVKDGLKLGSSLSHTGDAPRVEEAMYWHIRLELARRSQFHMKISLI